MSEFKRESRYLVLKLSDVEAALDDRQKGMLEGLTLTVDSHRISEGKSPLRAVVIEADWPIYEQAWELVKLQDVKDTIRKQAVPDWSKAPEGAKFWAVDFDGIACWFSLKPFPSMGRWCIDGTRKSSDFGYLKDRQIVLPPKTTFPDWKLMLHKRSEGDA